MKLEKYETACGRKIWVSGHVYADLRIRPGVIAHLATAISRIVLPHERVKFEYEIQIENRAVGTLGDDANAPDCGKPDVVSVSPTTLTIVAKPNAVAGHYDLIAAWLGTHNRKQLAWHYTTQQKFELIVESGVLLPSDLGVFEPEQPILWFSTNPTFEPMVFKNFVRNGANSCRMAALRELHNLEGGLVRFGCSIVRLRRGENLRKAAIMEIGMWRRLVTLGALVGSNPADWWGHVGPMAIDDVSIEVMDSEMEWQPLV